MASRRIFLGGLVLGGAALLTMPTSLIANQSEKITLEYKFFLPIGMTIKDFENLRYRFFKVEKVDALTEEMTRLGILQNYKKSYRDGVFSYSYEFKNLADFKNYVQAGRRLKPINKKELQLSNVVYSRKIKTSSV